MFVLCTLQAEEVLDGHKDNEYDYPEEAEVLALAKHDLQLPGLTIGTPSVRIPLSTFEVCVAGFGSLF